MIIVRVELHSAVTGQVTELARMGVANVGGSKTRGDYDCVTWTGRDKDALDRASTNHTFTRKGKIKDHPRLQEHVWCLVAKALAAMNYGSVK